MEDEFLKEKQDIREKMLKYSRAIKEGRRLDLEHLEPISSNDLLKKRKDSNKKKNFFDNLEENEYKDKIKSNIYLKEDLIDVKLEEKKPFASRFFSKNSFKKNKEKSKKNPKNASQIQIITPKVDVVEKSVQKPLELKKKYSTRVIKKNQNDFEQSLKAKSALLEGYNEVTKVEIKNLNYSHLLFALSFVIFFCIFFIPQIYIRNEIYYLSRDIAILRNQEMVLNEENKELKRNLESMRFQNQILDYLE